MRLHEQIRDKVITNIDNKQSFTIKSSPKAFKILSDNLYTDKIKAIIRELSCNAFDGHVAAGHNNPFKVHLPNNIEPYFSVIDYGPGMSDDAIFELYTSYFSSDKQDRNDLVGMLGLGSKSPFAYTDSFTVESRYDGKKSIFSCFIDQTGTPCVSKLSEEPFDKSTGITVMLSVKKENFEEFINTAKEVYHFFEIKPEIIGNPSFVHLDKRILYEGNGWRIYDNNNFLHQKISVIQGNVGYIVDKSSFPDDKYDMLFSNETEIIFNIGDLDVAASRERLSYDNITKERIQKRFDRVIDEINNKILDELNECSCFWDAQRKFLRIIQTLEEVGDLKWQERILLHENPPMPEGLVFYCHKKGTVVRSQSIRGEHKFQLFKTYIFLKDDMNKPYQTIRKARDIVFNNTGVIVVLIEDEELIKNIGNPPLKLSSTISVFTKKRKQSKELEAAYFNGSCFNNKIELKSNSLHNEDKDLKRYYIIKKYSDCYFNKKLIKERDVEIFWRFINDEKFQLWGVSPRNVAKIAIKFKMLDFMEHVQKKVKDSYQKHEDELNEYIKIKKCQRSYFQQLSARSRDLFDADLKLDNLNSKYYELKNIYDEFVRNSSDRYMEELLQISEFFGLCSRLKEVDTKNATLTDYYPMLRYWYVDKNVGFSAVKDYINLVDNAIHCK